MTTSLLDLRNAAKQRSDRVNATTITNDEWNGYVNGGLAALYRLLTQTYEDYNVQTYSFTLAGANILQVGAGSLVPSFDKIRYLSRLGALATYTPVMRADSPMEFDRLSAYGNLQRVKYWLYGASLEIRPAASAAGSYVLYFIPSFQKLVNDTDTIDGSWMATNGIEEYAILDAAAKAMVKEESLDTAQLLMADRERVKNEVLQQFAQRDDNQPGRIQDTKSARGYGAWDGRGGWR